MTPSTSRPNPADLLKMYKIASDVPLYIVGAFDNHITALSQQVRALNLAYAAVETGAIDAEVEEISTVPVESVAIIGAGFAGLTLAAALLKKNARVRVTIFEERDTLIPLQQGSDSRWLHPHIYDWPDPGSETSAAMLPVLNWTAGRASDVVVQILSEWRQVVQAKKPEAVRLFCNSHHLQLSGGSVSGSPLKIEWVGEQRDPATGTTLMMPVGQSETFDHVFLTVGFGVEKEKALSYWRNETYGQPGLGSARTTYIVSGQGDGAMIDLLRLSISQFRQDRILDELFDKKTDLIARLESLKADVVNGSVGQELFSKFEDIRSTTPQMAAVVEQLSRRLRRDTEVILQLRVANLENLFDGKTSRVSFQNALLVYLVYCCGGFFPSHESVKDLQKRYGVIASNVVMRRGTDREGQLNRMMCKELYEKVLEGEGRLKQPARIMWSAGYFGTPGRTDQKPTVGDPVRKTWRKEYLPGPTALVATSLAGTLAGVVQSLQPTANQFRVVLHRVLTIEAENLLQQACEYQGKGLDLGVPGAARVFPVNLATIGQAYQTEKIIRSQRDVASEKLSGTMTKLDLAEAASAMSSDVGFVLTIPILQPAGQFFGPSRVAGEVYIDSQSPEFWLDDNAVAKICDCIQAALEGLETGSASFARLRNIQLNSLILVSSATKPLDGSESLQALETVHPPVTNAPFHFNFEHSDL